jgi:hypothetical protein
LAEPGFGPALVVYSALRLRLARAGRKQARSLALTARSRQFVRPHPSLRHDPERKTDAHEVQRRHAKPVTPFKEDYSLDLPTFERLLDFHVRTGATAISWPHHKGESLNLTIAERKLFAEAAVRVVNGRIPVTVHVSALAVEDTMELARHAQQVGADGILAITPYFWTPSLAAVHAYFVRLCGSIELPVLVLQLAELSRRCRDHRRF